MNENIENKLKEIERNSQAIEALYQRLNGVYDSLSMKMGLISSGFSSVMGALMPYLRELDKPKPRPAPTPTHTPRHTPRHR